MSNKILFIFEGEKTERQIVESFRGVYFSENTLILSVFGNVIYELYREMAKDNDLDVFSLIKERNQSTLEGFQRNDFAEIYLFFDYDGHSHVANDKELNTLLHFFENETDRGKLYISYPMVEALKHISDWHSFKHLEVECKITIGYKKIVNDEGLSNLRNYKKYNALIWSELINCHLKKMNYIANSIFEFPDRMISQQTTFAMQKEKYIEPRQTVGVVSAFPAFIHDYFGNEKTKMLITAP